MGRKRTFPDTLDQAVGKHGEEVAGTDREECWSSNAEHVEGTCRLGSGE